MSGKFMKKMKIVIPTITMILIASQLFGCSACSKEEMVNMVNNNEQIEIEVATLEHEEQGTDTEISWIPLADLQNYGTFREKFEKVFNTEYTAYTKTGILFIDSDGNNNGNNTLLNVFTNKKFIDSYWNNATVQEDMMTVAVELYADVDENSTDSLYASINAYFNLLDDNEVNYYNGQASLTRGQAMALLMRATTPVEDLKANDKFAKAVGSSEYTDYASYVADDSYLTTEDKSLNNQTFNGTITRGEYIYMVLKNIYGLDVISNTDIKGVKLNDCKVTTEKYEYKETSYVKSYDLSYAIQSPDNGAPEGIYKAVAVAKKFNIISAESRWDEALTKSEAVEILIDTILSYNESKGYKTESESGAIAEKTVKQIATESYNLNKDSINVPEESYVNEFISRVENGSTPEEVEKALIEYYKNVVEEMTTETPTEEATTPTTQKDESTYIEEVVESGNDIRQVVRTYANGTKEYYFYDDSVNVCYKTDSQWNMSDADFADYIRKLEALENSDTNSNEGSTEVSGEQSNTEEETTSTGLRDFGESDWDPDREIEGGIRD